MANEALLNKGTTLTLEANGAQILDTGTLTEANDDTRAAADNTGYPLGIFEFENDGTDPWSAAPTAGAAIHLYEQKYLSQAADYAPTPDANYKHDYLWTWNVDPADVQQRYISPPLPISVDGAKYFIEWVDGGSGTADLQSGWSLKLTPCTYGTA